MTANQLIVKMIFDRWNALLNICNSIFNTITDEQLLKEIAPGRNRAIYILGHLIAIHDEMLPLLNLGNNQHTSLMQMFVEAPDKSVEVIPSAHELQTLWKNQMAMLAPKLQSLSADEWFEKHNSVSAEDFINEPHRNKLNILLTRTTHLAYHVGQLKLIN